MLAIVLIVSLLNLFKCLVDPANPMNYGMPI